EWNELAGTRRLAPPQSLCGGQIVLLTRKPYDLGPTEACSGRQVKSEFSTRSPWLERPERLALDDRLLHKARPHLLRRAFRLRSGLGLSLGFLARRRIDFCFNDFERPDGGEQFVELVHGDIIFVGLKASLD